MIISEAAVYVNPEVLYYLQKTTAYSLKKRPLYFSKNSHLLCKIRTAPAEQLHDTILAGRKESRMKKKWISSAAFLYVSAALVMTGCAGGADTATKSVTAASETAPGPSETISPPGSTAAETGAVPETPPAPPAAPEHGKPGGPPPGDHASKPDHYDALVTAAQDTAIIHQTIRSEGADENAVLIENGASVRLFADDITRVSGDSSGGDSASFYGVGSAVLCTDGSAYVDTCDITTDADGGAGVFAYDKGTAYVSGAKIVTEQGASGGLHAAGGGTLYAWDCDVETGGESSAAIRSDRGGGTMVIEDGNYITRGQGSPAVYSTADITAAYATLEAKGSEAVCIEGDNQLRLFNCNLTGNMADLPQNGLTWNVILYQSMSGDSKEGNSLFEMNGGILEAGNGGMFYTTNTQSTFVLKGVELRPAKDQEFLLRAAGNSNGRGWGTKGHNGADCSFTAIQQELSGDVQWDSVSTLKFYLTDKSTLNGAFVQDEKDAGEGGEGLAELFIDSSSVWYVNGDCTVTKLHCAGTIEDTSGKSVTVRKSDGTVLAEGTSAYSITVEEYDKAPDLSGAGVVSNYEEFRKEKPAELH